MPNQPKLIAVRTPRDPEGVVVVLHGGASRRDSTMVSPTQLSVLRMVPVAKRIARAGKGRLAVYRLLNSSRGWDTTRTPVDDTRWALDELGQRHGPGVAAALVGHSLGGRAAILGSTHPAVSSVVAMNPFVYPQDGTGDFSGSEFLFVHGDADRIASPSRSADVARGIARSAEVGFISVAGGKHAMLRRHGLFDNLAADFVMSSLLDEKPKTIVAGVRDGNAWLTA